jgi:hypothetical protein
MLVVVGNCCGQLWQLRWWPNIVCLPTWVINSVFHLRYLMVLVKRSSVIMMQYTIPYRKVCYPVNRLGIQFSVLYRPNSWPQLPNTALNIYSSCLCFIRCITITLQKNFHFVYMPVSTHYNIQFKYWTRMQCNRQSARCKHAPKTYNFHGKNDM